MVYWTPDEMILVLDFYLNYEAQDITYDELAELVLPHPPNSPDWLMSNFKFLAGEGGASNYSRDAEWIWDTFSKDRRRLRKTAQVIRTNRVAKSGM